MGFVSMKQWVKKYRRQLRAKLLPFIFKGVSKLSYPILYGVAHCIGFLARIFPNSMKRIIKINIQLCFSELSESSKNALLKKVLFNNIASVLEFCKIWGSPPHVSLEYITQKSGEAEAIKALENGGILVTPHFGSWELVGLYASVQYHVMLMYRPSRVGLDALLLSARQNAGAIAVPANQTGVKEMMKALRKGDVVGILPDQDPGLGDGEFAPFFGVSTKTMTLVSRLAQRYQLPVYLLTIVRNSERTGFELTYTQLESPIYDEDIGISVAHLNETLEKVIKRHPEQYLWSYPRFKSRPDSQPSFYDVL